MRSVILSLIVATAVVTGLAGCDVVLQSQQGETIAQADKANDVAAKADVSTAKIALVSYLVANGELPTVADLEKNGYTPSEGVDPVTLVIRSATDYCLQVVSNTGTAYRALPEGSVEEGTCS